MRYTMSMLTAGLILRQIQLRLFVSSRNITELTGHRYRSGGEALRYSLFLLD